MFAWSSGVRKPVSPAPVVRRYTSAGRTWSSHAPSEARNDATMIAIETSRLTAATIVARLSIDWPGAPRSCATASRSPAARGMRSSPKNTTARRAASA